MNNPELNIVVPFLNEREQLPEFLADLQHQQQTAYELLFVDGGSTDGSLEWLQQTGFVGQVLSSPAGRARQMNLGGQQATADWLLFLHADSRFEDPLSLRKALDQLQQTESRNLAGHFALKFRRSDKQPSAAYYFYEWKARLGRPETIHGDQGFLLRTELFRQLGGFREEMLVMEDTDFAERLRAVGQWQLLPAEISTSARRFETEGLWQRQLLGALIMCFRSIGWQQFFDSAADVYRQQSETDNLKVEPFFQLVRHLLADNKPNDAWRLWLQSGGYVRNHAWQLLFALDSRLAFSCGTPVGEGRARLTNFIEPVYDFLTNYPTGRFAAALLLRLWFSLTHGWLKVIERKS